MSTITVRHGKVFGERWKAQINAFVLDPEAETYKGATRGLHVRMKQTDRLPALTSNGYDDAAGVWYGSRYEPDEGSIVIMKSQIDFMKVPHSLSVLVIRTRPTGPLLLIKGVFPVIAGFQHQSDLVVFQGRGDILEEYDLRDLGLWKLIHPYDRDRSFDLDQRGECFDIRENKRVNNYQPMPELVTVHDDGTDRVRVAAIPKTPVRKLRITKPKGGSTPPRKRRRRRRSHE